MIRIVIENIILFLLPTVVYVIYVVATRNSTRKGILDEAPLAGLLLAGTALVLLVLVVYGSDKSGGKPGDRYIPPSMKDGQIEPGRIQ
ncbi:MAG: DUF6111 family protein [Hyphomicrobiaceae bacterium]